MWAAAAIGAAMGLFFQAAPAPERIALEIVDRLGIEAEEARSARRPEPVRPAHAGVAIGAGLFLPALLWAAKAWGPVAQGAAFFAFAALAPEIVRRIFEGRLAIIPRAEILRRIERGVRAGIAGAVLAAGLVNGSHWLSGTGAHLDRCRDPGGYPASLTRRALARELAEVRGGRGGTGTGHGVVLAVLLIPLAEERVYRGLVQRVLARRWGTGPGIFAGAFLFGAAHLGVYQVAVYQTVLLGIASGVACAEGGVLAAVVAHALWNAHALF
jgi:membrane protease YdiL (CAAX protease family)